MINLTIFEKRITLLKEKLSFVEIERSQASAFIQNETLLSLINLINTVGNFAHGYNELKAKTHVPSNYKTKYCKKDLKGKCNYGDRCIFKH